MSNSTLSFSQLYAIGHQPNLSNYGNLLSRQLWNALTGADPRPHAAYKCNNAICDSYAKRLALAKIGVEAQEGGNICKRNHTHNSYRQSIHVELADIIVTNLRSSVLDRVPEARNEFKGPAHKDPVNQLLVSLIKLRAGFLGLERIESDRVPDVPDLNNLFLTKLNVHGAKHDITVKILAENLSISLEEAANLVTKKNFKPSQSRVYADKESVLRLAELHAMAHIASLATSAIVNGDTDFMSSRVQASIFANHNMISSAMTIQSNIARTIAQLKTHNLSDKIVKMEALKVSVDKFNANMEAVIRMGSKHIASDIYNVCFSLDQSSFHPIKSTGFGTDSVYHVPILQNALLKVVEFGSSSETPSVGLVPFSVTPQPVAALDFESQTFRIERIYKRYSNVVHNCIFKALETLISYATHNPSYDMNSILVDTRLMLQRQDLGDYAAIKDFIKLVKFNGDYVATHNDGSVIDMRYNDLAKSLPRKFDAVFDTFHRTDIPNLVDSKLVKCLNYVFSSKCIFAGLPRKDSSGNLLESVVDRFNPETGLAYKIGGVIETVTFVPKTWEVLEKIVSAEFDKFYTTEFKETESSPGCSENCVLRRGPVVERNYFKAQKWDHFKCCDHDALLTAGLEGLNKTFVPKAL